MTWRNLNTVEWTDEMILEALYGRDVLGQSCKATADAMADHYKLPITRNSVIGITGRIKAADRKVKDKCRRKANKDGGMPDRWWVR